MRLVRGHASRFVVRTAGTYALPASAASETDARVSRCPLCGQEKARRGRRGPAPMHDVCLVRSRAATRLRQAARELLQIGEEALAAEIHRQADRLAPR